MRPVDVVGVMVGAGHLIVAVAVVALGAAVFMAAAYLTAAALL